MKSHFIFACAVLMFFVTSFSLGEIIQDGNWSYYGEAQGDTGWSSVSAWADGDDYGHLHIAGGWEYTYTTEAGSFDWEYYIYVWAEANIWVSEEESCSAAAYSEAYAEEEGGGLWNWLYTDHPAYGPIDVDESEAGELPDYVYDGTFCGFVNGIWNYGIRNFEANEGVYAEHLVVAEAGVQQGCNNEAYSHACADAWTGLTPEE